MTINSFKERNTFKLALSGVLIALGVVLSAFFIPIGGSKCFPIQHLINVLSAVLLGPVYTLINAFLISLIRNITGMGSILAFPGSMIGALLASLIFQRFKHYRLACFGELFGTGIIGGIMAAPIAVALMGKEVGLFFYVIPFVISSLAGSFIALLIFESSALMVIIKKRALKS